MTIARPRTDPELAAALAVMGSPAPSTITADMIPALREMPLVQQIEEEIAAAGVEVHDRTFVSHDGAEVMLSVVQAKGRTGTGPCFYHLHGGGMILGDRRIGLTVLLDWLHRYNGIAVTIDYRLAPEFPDPVPLEDCYAGLVWTADNAAELGIDPDRIVILGASAGGGLAAGTALLARDRHGPPILGQLLMCPMIDDRCDTVSTMQFDGVGLWDRGSNLTGWTALLGKRRGTDDVSIYAAPARATDLSNLPPAFIDCGSAEVFRDEDVAYASAIWASGGQAELHVWPGGFHGFELFAPQLALSQHAVKARDNWVQRLLGA